MAHADMLLFAISAATKVLIVRHVRLIRMANKKGSKRKQLDLGHLILGGLTIADSDAIETTDQLLKLAGMGIVTLNKRLDELGYEIVTILAIRGKGD
jgi:hypothetical protein